MAEDRTNLLLIGYGYMGRVYKNACARLLIDRKYETYYKYGLPALLDGLSLTAIVEPLPVDAKGELGDFPDIKIFHDLESCFAFYEGAGEDGINAAVIASPIATHFDIACECIKKRVNLLIEKPVCGSSSEIEELITLAREHDVRIMPGHVERYNPVTLELREAVRYGMYGPVKGYQIMRTSRKPERVKDPLVIDKLVHDVDLVRYVFGDYRVEDINLEKKDGEIMECRISTSHRNGYGGEIFSSWLVPEKKRQVIVNFENAVFTGDMLEKEIKVNRLTEFSKEIRCYKNNQIKDELCDFIAYMHHPIPTLVKMKDALKSARIIDYIMRMVGL